MRVLKKFATMVLTLGVLAISGLTANAESATTQTIEIGYWKVQLVPGNFSDATIVGFSEKGESEKNTVNAAITIPSTVTSTKKYKGTYTVTAIGPGAFKEDKFTSVTMTGNVKTIGNNAFMDCPNLRVATLRGKLQVIEYNAFKRCAKLRQADLGSYVTQIGAQAFRDCSTLTSIGIPSDGNKITRLGNYCFSGCDKLESFNFGAALTTNAKIEEYAFSLDTSLQYVDLSVLGEGASVGSNAFVGCSGIQGIDVSNMFAEQIDDSAFAGVNFNTLKYYHKPKEIYVPTTKTLDTVYRNKAFKLSPQNDYTIKVNNIAITQTTQFSNNGQYKIEKVNSQGDTVYWTIVIDKKKPVIKYNKKTRKVTVTDSLGLKYVTTNKKHTLKKLPTKYTFTFKKRKKVKTFTLVAVDKVGNKTTKKVKVK